MEGWDDLPDSEKMSLPFFERNLLSQTTHAATAYWVAAQVHPADLSSGRLYVVHMVIEEKDSAFNFLWPMICLKHEDRSISWHFPVIPEDKAPSQANVSEARCTDVVGIVMHVSRGEEPIDLPFLPGFKLS